MWIVARTTGSPSSVMLSGNDDAVRKPPRIDVKMRCIEADESVGIQSRLKWRVRRGVIALRPPPAGPHAARKDVFCTFLKKSFLRS